MTAEVAVLNKSAVALAADSAMTTEVGGLRKIYPAQKLFPLAKEQPVGVMVYNNAELVGIPWETIVKMYYLRSGEQNCSRETVTKYLHDLMAFAGEPLFGDSVELEAHSVGQIAQVAFQRVLLTMDDTGLGPATAAEIELAKERERSPSMAGVDSEAVVKRNLETVDREIDAVFAEQDPDPLKRAQLRYLVATAIRNTSPFPTDYTAGVVVAGFGTEEVFPALTVATIHGVIEGKVKYDVGNEVRIGNGLDREPTQIMAFAQHDMVTRFMEGVDPLYLEYLEESTRLATVQFVDATLAALQVNLMDTQRRALERNVRQHVRDYFSRAADVRREQFISPILESLNHLPKSELAGMAEALVNLTALKRRVSDEMETVSGPIDVAVISKGDGFVWIRRQHYFDPDLNQTNFGV